MELEAAPHQALFYEWVCVLGGVCVRMCLCACTHIIHLCVYVIRDVYCTDVWGFFAFYDTLQPNYLLVYGHTALSFFYFFPVFR